MNALCPRPPQTLIPQKRSPPPPPQPQLSSWLQGGPSKHLLGERTFLLCTWTRVTLSCSLGPRRRRLQANRSA